MILPNELPLLVAAHLDPAHNAKTLANFCLASRATRELLTPLLWRDLMLSQNQLMTLLNTPCPSYTHVRSLTLTAMAQTFDLSSSPGILAHHPNPETPLFVNADTLKFAYYVDYAPPGYDQLPLLLRCRRVIIDSRVYSWRVGCIPRLWPSSLTTIELHCKNWTVPFIAPGIHHIIHISQIASPFRHTDVKGDIDPCLPANEAYRHLLESTFRWVTFAIENIAIKEKVDGTGVTTSELRIRNGGLKEIEWAERRMGEMLVEAGLGEGRVELDEQGAVRVKSVRLVRATV